MKRLSAFTIIELCIVMLLSALVTGIAFFTLNIFQNSVHRYKTDAHQMADLALLHRLLAQDVWQSKEVVFVEEGIEVRKKNCLVFYSFTPTYILRKKEEAIVDTFHFQHDRLVRLFRKQEISLPGLVVDEISFDLIHKGETQAFCFYKMYAADLLMQQEEIQEYNDGWH